MTAVAAGKDRVIDPHVDTDGADFVAFSDAPQSHLRAWEVRPLPLWSRDAQFSGRRHARLPKVLSQLLLPGYDFYIWMDGNFTLKHSPHSICTRLLADPNDDVAVFRHRLRRCVYQEAREILRYQLDHPDLVRQQMSEYRRQNMPRNIGLYETGAFVLRSSLRTMRLSIAWWEHICRFSSRDQLSFPYAVWATNVNLAVIDDMNIHNNAYFSKMQHHCYPHAIPPLRRRVSQTLRSLAKRVIRRTRSNTA